MMDVGQYLCRIGCTSPMAVTLETLQQVHRCHLLTVPFESLSIHCGENIRLELPHIFEKIVVQRRGGFCYENNSLFGWLLSELGFEVKLLSAQVRNAYTGVYGPPQDHLILLVNQEGQRWLCDVGFGAGFRTPLSLETNLPQSQENGVFRIHWRGETLILETIEREKQLPQGGGKEQAIKAEESKGVREIMTDKGQKGWKALYKFTLEACCLEDFKEMFIYHQTSPSSLFYCKALCSLHLPSGRITYIGHRLITTHLLGEGTQTQTVVELSNTEISAILKEKFGIELLYPLVPKDVDIVPPSIIY